MISHPTRPSLSLSSFIVLKLAYRQRAMFVLPPSLSLTHLQAELGLQSLAGELSSYVSSPQLPGVVSYQPGSNTENINNSTQKQHSTDCLHKLIDLIDHKLIPYPLTNTHTHNYAILILLRVTIDQSCCHEFYILIDSDISISYFSLSGNT